MMRGVLRAIIAAAGVSVVSPAVAQGIAQNGLTVAPSGQGFEVFVRPGQPGAAYFCAAADFARRDGATANDRIVVTRAVGPSPSRTGQRSVGFTLAPPDPSFLQSGGVLLDVRTTGANVSVGHAIAQCFTSAGDGSF